jgi:dephospho-CoA kinase
LSIKLIILIKNFFAKGIYQFSKENRLKISAELPCDIIENNGTLTDLKKQTKQLYQKLNQSVGI